jgi:PTS system nitrogen regulatory IIA component
MQRNELLTKSRTVAHASCTSKKRTLESVARILADDLSLPETTIFKGLFEREKLGSTGVGHGVAIPHCRIEGLESISGALLTLETAVDFEAPDQIPVDIIFALVVPEDCSEGHLEALQTIATELSRDDFRETLRSKGTYTDLYESFVN